MRQYTNFDDCTNPYRFIIRMSQIDKLSCFRYVNIYNSETKHCDFVSL